MPQYRGHIRIADVAVEVLDRLGIDAVGEEQLISAPTELVDQLTGA